MFGCSYSFFFFFLVGKRKERGVVEYVCFGVEEVCVAQILLWLFNCSSENFLLYHLLFGCARKKDEDVFVSASGETSSIVLGAVCFYVVAN